MPTYDFACPTCGDLEEDIVLSLAEHEAGISCSQCRRPMRSLISSVPTVGPMPSKPVRIGGAGFVADSKEKLDAYRKANPEVQVVSRDSSDWQGHRDRSREKAETVARAQGYRDWGQRQETVKKENKKKRELGS